jgi:hypothetical protein
VINPVQWKKQEKTYEKLQYRNDENSYKEKFMREFFIGGTIQTLHDIKFQHKHDDEVIAKNFAEIIFNITSALTGQ